MKLSCLNKKFNMKQCYSLMRVNFVFCIYDFELTRDPKNYKSTKTNNLNWDVFQ